MIRVGVVEDDERYRHELLTHLARYSEEHGVEMQTVQFTDGEDLVATYRPDYDLLFLDIEMPRLDGLEAARRIRQVDPHAVIIFVTNMAQYAVKGYEVAALSYLIKPVSYFALAHEVTRSIEKLYRARDEPVVINVGGRLARLDVSDIVYVESIKHRITIHTLSGEYAFSGTLKAVELELAERGFFRSNNCYLVNLRHVTQVEQSACTMVNGDSLQVSRPRKRAFLDALTDYVGGRVL